MVTDIPNHYFFLLRKSLNPYCNGRWSLTLDDAMYGENPVGLNPYCNGRWSLTLAKAQHSRVDKEVS